jgi:large subunit ribosomal protein L10
MESKNAALLAKEAEVEAIRDRIERAMAAVLVDFRGLDVPLTTELRARFRAKGVEYKVIKNTLMRKALEGTRFEGNETLIAHLAGPTAVAFSYEDPSSAAKIIRDFRKELKGPNEGKLAVKCGVLDAEVLDDVRVETELAALPSKDEARSMLLAQLLAPMQSLVRQLSAPAQNLAYVLDAKQRQDD